MGGALGGERWSRLPVSANESPKLIMDLKHMEEACSHPHSITMRPKNLRLDMFKEFI